MTGTGKPLLSRSLRSLMGPPMPRDMRAASEWVTAVTPGYDITQAAQRLRDCVTTVATVTRRYTPTHAGALCVSLSSPGYKGYNGYGEEKNAQYQRVASVTPRNLFVDHGYARRGGRA